ncbi:hypothetical protein [Desulfosporosinus hippei]|uniref:Uncharacterized protein n=1 Tax=Desulfosporosinus hippei DSM 8344 TaxID=1121419 RepID=A0A1G8CFX0_9FIRM|nr:hypothetical protein [Desulfosporosinus hippei]SDH44123.1 hypothetical protein SAMN05443529_11385 [Desulfosporosinus hippei DSM 8344]
MSNFQLVRGCKAPDLTGIHEAYSISTGKGFQYFEINVSAENIDRVFRELTKEVVEPAFLLLEHGTNRFVEDELRKIDTDPFHKDVHYMDGLTYKYLMELFDAYGELLINDGGSSFGFGSHKGIDEVFVTKYKIFNIYTNDPVKYENKLIKLGFSKVEKLKTVWETFTPETPGECETIEINGLDVYGLVEHLSTNGMYLAERRED